MEPLGLTDDEKSALVAFLEALSGDPIEVEPPKLPDYEPLVTSGELAATE